MNASENRELGVSSLAILLVSAHYGLGFLLGTAEQSMTKGAIGSLYAVSIGLGTIGNLVLAKFYWTRIEQIWTLLGRYGNSVKVGVGLMSWTSLIGIEAVQIIAAASILAVVGIPGLLSMIALTLLFWFLSLLPVEKASWVFRGLLLLNILALVYGLWALHGLPDYARSPLEFISSLDRISGAEVIGVSFSTMLLVLIDMKCQQYIIQARNVRTVYLGSILAALLVIALAFLPYAVVIAAQNTGILPTDLDAKQVIPYILSWVGGGANQPLGIILIAALAVPALGLGSSVLRVQTKTVLDLQIVPQFPGNYILIAGVNGLFALAVAFKGGEIISLILLFYTTYLSAVWIPFIAYLVSEIGVYTFCALSVKLSLLLGSLSALTTLIFTLYQPYAVIWNNAELTIMVMGLGFGILSLLVGQLLERYIPVSTIKG